MRRYCNTVLSNHVMPRGGEADGVREGVPTVTSFPGRSVPPLWSLWPAGLCDHPGRAPPHSKEGSPSSRPAQMFSSPGEARCRQNAIEALYKAADQASQEHRLEEQKPNNVNKVAALKKNFQSTPTMLQKKRPTPSKLPRPALRETQVTKVTSEIRVTKAASAPVVVSPTQTSFSAARARFEQAGGRVNSSAVATSGIPKPAARRHSASAKPSQATKSPDAQAAAATPSYPVLSWKDAKPLEPTPFSPPPTLLDEIPTVHSAKALRSFLRPERASPPPGPELATSSVTIEQDEKQLMEEVTPDSDVDDEQEYMIRDAEEALKAALEAAEEAAKEAKAAEADAVEAAMTAAKAKAEALAELEVEAFETAEAVEGDMVQVDDDVAEAAAAEADAALAVTVECESLLSTVSDLSEDERRCLLAAAAITAEWEAAGAVSPRRSAQAEIKADNCTTTNAEAAAIMEPALMAPELASFTAPTPRMLPLSPPSPDRLVDSEDDDDWVETAPNKAAQQAAVNLAAILADTKAVNGSATMPTLSAAQPTAPTTPPRSDAAPLLLRESLVSPAAALYTTPLPAHSCAIAVPAERSVSRRQIAVTAMSFVVLGAAATTVAISLRRR